jgi:NAD-dependent deacetylase
MKKIVVLTGAGISAESGLKTFRDADGLWENHRIEDVATPEAFRANPDLVYRFYNLRRAQLNEVQPNLGHLALVELEKEWPGDFLLVTQNVDNLHERAGSKKTIHMHGELQKVRCEACSTIFLWKEDLDRNHRCNACKVKGQMRPHIVWFGEMPLAMDQIYAALEECDVFVSIGTSGLVYPAASFVRIAQKAQTVEINLNQTDISGNFDKTYLGPASVQLPLFLKDLDLV